MDVRASRGMKSSSGQCGADVRRRPSMLEKSYARYEAALHALARYGRRLRLEGYKFYEYERIVQLSDRLEDKYQTYKKTHDMTAILKEIAHFEADPWNLNHREDGLVPTRLG